MRRIAAFVGLIVFSATVVPSAHAGIMHEPEVTPESAYLEYAEMFPSVGYMFAQDNGTSVSFSSGVVIDEHWVLTSAHGVLSDNNDPMSIHDSFKFGLGPSSSDPDEVLFSYEAFINPNYVGEENGPDLALLYFEDAFTTIDPALLYTGNVFDLDGTDASIAGYGAPGTVSTGIQPLDGVKRAGVNVVESVDGTFEQALFLPESFNDGRSLGILGAPGDSGGGWFIEDEGDFYLTAISSFANTNPRYGASTYGSLIGPELAWVNETIASKEVPEPATAALLLAGLSAGAFRRKRRQE